MNQIIHLRTNFSKEEILDIVALTACTNSSLTAEYEAILCAIYLWDEDFKAKHLDDLRSHIADLETDRIRNMIDGAKRRLHKMEYIEFTGATDFRRAAFLADIESCMLDVVLVNPDSGDLLDMRVNPKLVADLGNWFKRHPGGTDMPIDERLADVFGVKKSKDESGNAYCRVSYFADVIQNLARNDMRWAHCQALPIAAVGLLVVDMYMRYRKGQITLDEFRWKAVKISGLKAAESVGITVLMSIPGINVVTGSIMIAQLVLSASRML